MNAYWIQRADTSKRHFPTTDEVGAMVAFESHDWRSELLFKAQLEMEGVEFCEPGIGFVTDDGKTLHICPLTHANADYHFRFVQTKKVLGLIPRTSSRVLSRRNQSFLECLTAIEHFFREDWAFFVGPGGSLEAADRHG
jgi:hypothetical protein